MFLDQPSSSLKSKQVAPNKSSKRTSKAQTNTKGRRGNKGKRNKQL